MLRLKLLKAVVHVGLGLQDSVDSLKVLVVACEDGPLVAAADADRLNRVVLCCLLAPMPRPLSLTLIGWAARGGNFKF